MKKDEMYDNGAETDNYIEITKKCDLFAYLDVKEDETDVILRIKIKDKKVDGKEVDWGFYIGPIASQKISMLFDDHGKLKNDSFGCKMFRLFQNFRSLFRRE